MDVYALVGGAGTGKSHRASVIAHEYAIDLIIDDGLLIKNSRILAGRSAKREETRVAAVRRAMFSNAQHAAEVRERLREFNPRRVLVLGTSRGMVHRITDALDLPRPMRYIPIEDVATPDEIRRALRSRREQGKHVIPAPTLEVRRTFSGYLVDPLHLRLFRRSRRAAGDLHVEKSVVRPTFGSLGRFYIADSVVAAIAARACREVDGVTRVAGAAVTSRPEGVHLSLGVGIRYGHHVVRTMEAVQQRVREVVEHTTALNVLDVAVVARWVSLG